MKKSLTLWVACFCFAVVPGVVRSADAPTKAAAAAVDISGTWDLVVQTEQGSGTPVFTFKQDGEKLTGTYKGQLGEAPVTGTLKGNVATFSITVNMGEEMKIVYTGTVDGAAIKGSVKFGTEGEGSFTGKRR